MIDPQRLKSLEDAADAPAICARQVLYVRLDGRAFSTLTGSLPKPRCPAFSDAMISVTADLLRRSNAQTAYQQSDEISLLWTPAPTGGTHPFGGRALKIATTLAGEASALLQARLRDDRSPLAADIPHFDARVLGLSRTDAAEMIAWRAQDAWRNAISALAQSRFPRQRLHGMSLRDRLAALAAVGETLTGQDPAFLYGLLLDLPETEAVLDATQLARIPPAHRPTGPVRRRVLRQRALPKMWRIPNLVEVLLHGADPEPLS